MDDYELKKLSFRNWCAFHRICNDALYQQPYKALGLSARFNAAHYNPFQVALCSPPYTTLPQQSFVLNFRGSPAATISVSPLSKATSMASVTNVAVDRKKQGHGHGIAMLKHVAAWSKHAGLTSLCVNADANPESNVVGFYERAGFLAHVWDQDILDDWNEEISGLKPVQLVREL